MSNWLDIAREARDVLTAAAAITAGIKAWLADKKAKRIEKDVTDIKIVLGQQQAQRQSQNITVNVSTGSGPTETGSVTLSPPSAEEQS